MTDVTFTRVSGELFTWEGLMPCSIRARYLWIALYVSPRRAVPGLWNAGMPTFCDVAKMQVDDAIPAMDELLDRELVEWDRGRDVLRITRFPDRLERPNNGRHIRSFWTRFRAVPACAIRDAHVETLHWLLTDPELPATPDHEAAWSDTFGKVQIPPHRKRGVQRLQDSDTGTGVQGSLFTVPTTIHSQIVVPTTETIRYPIPYTHTHRSTIYDLSSSSSTEEESKPRANLLALPPPPDPGDLPFTITEMLSAIAHESSGRFAPAPCDERLHDGLCATIRACVAVSVGLADLRVVGKWLASGGLSFRSDLGPSWAAKPGNLIDAVASARAWGEAGYGAIAGSGKRAARIEPTPVGAHGTGRRRL